jgi:hypothetical protein
MARSTSSIFSGDGGVAPRPSPVLRPGVGTASTRVVTSAANPFGGAVLQQPSGFDVGTFTPPPFFTGPPAPNAPAPPPSPTATASDLQVMISAIPFAQEGTVITADLHNALRQALTSMADRLGIEPVEEEITITNAPRLGGLGTFPWDHDYGIARRPANVGVGGIRGWMEVDLPDGARIKKMVIFATTGTNNPLKLKLKRQKVTDPTVTSDLIVIDVPIGNDASKGIDGDVTVPGTGAGAVAIEEFRIVNNREQKYLVTAELEAVNDATDKLAQINAIQIVCGR